MLFTELEHLNATPPAEIVEHLNSTMTKQRSSAHIVNSTAGNADLDTMCDALETGTLANQHALPLLRLPAELRTQIFTYVFAVGAATLCGHGKCSECIIGFGCENRFDEVKWKWHYPRTLLNLLLVSRQLYAETKFLIFSTNMFAGCAEDLGAIFLTKTSHEQLSTVRTIGLLVSEITCVANCPEQVIDRISGSYPALQNLSSLKTLVILWLRVVPAGFGDRGKLHEALEKIAKGEMGKLMPDKDLECEATKWHCCESCDAIADADDNDEDGDDSDEDEDSKKYSEEDQA
ncbi:hypothetical protein HBH56_092980 [Parastagonospora nodorum]|uniref:Uncharacterized protein n=1 Tax=Phaeosphaeria nodorum (strain SN15 / ATCC MYA-4574 / FGSC 10173) TaxID=321614 RepID=A0A7U2I1J6_PHANO|nr:hypothetical protein HBH56_092980 [Parastagonospora nodorum]QRC98414.1 hypothetical protein JI435_044790 [Parastagonospora nodorum SN15]KAH3936682.1 hypothetical protein HBH54_027630 [Parastagonospora nodorum]KAH3948149.1 hypothetical protein HBH53_102450 [Parastagonospora nodorum]KAH3956463.1 hypothetical protein HBH51_241120 [Parastagonospora nodorum]